MLLIEERLVAVVASASVSIEAIRVVARARKMKNPIKCLKKGLSQACQIYKFDISYREICAI